MISAILLMSVESTDHPSVERLTKRSCFSRFKDIFEDRRFEFESSQLKNTLKSAFQKIRRK